MKMRAVRLLSPARILGVLLAGAALSAHAAATVTLVFTNAPSGTYSNGVPVVVQAVATPSGLPDPATNTAMTLWFRTLAPLCTNLWNAVPMASNGLPANVWQATVPRLPAGTVDYYVTCDFTGNGAASPVSTATNAYTVGAGLPAGRYADFQDNWANLGNFQYTNAVGWTGSYTIVGIISGLSLNWNGSGRFGMLINTNAASFLMGPLLPEGVSFVAFEAMRKNTANTNPATFAVQISTNAGGAWNTLYTNGLVGATVYHTTVPVTNVYGPALVRLLRTSYSPSDAVNNSGNVFDHIALPPPPANLALSVPGNVVTPFAPQSFEAVTLRCDVADASTNVPTISRRMTAWYNWTGTNGSSTGWIGVPMTNSPAAPFAYAAVLTNAAGQGLEAGTNQYYFTCDFDGYYFTNSDKRASVTSAPSSYVINFANVAMMQLGTNSLSFGGVATNAVASLPVAVFNGGNVPLSVTNVALPAPFGCATALPLVVPPGGTSNLLVTFAPPAMIPYSGTLTVWSDATTVTGTNTVALAGTGMLAEATTMLTLNGPPGGPKNTPLAFTASASNNYNHPVEFQFDWGDGSPLTWSGPAASGALFTNTHAWTTATTFSVTARARCATDTNALTPWYAPPLSITLTNTRTIRLVGNLPGKLDFGGVLTNATAPQTLKVCNDGVDTLTVTNLLFGDPRFARQAPALPFQVPMGATTDVTLAFTPPDTNAYSGLLTVLSDALGGANTITLSGTGIVTEAISTPSLAGASFGTPGQTLSFWGQAFDNYGYQIRYQFDWGGGVTSGWGAAVASGTVFTNSTSWASPSTNQVRVQAANATNLSMVSSWSAPLTVTIGDTRILGLSGSLAFGIAVTNIGSAPQMLTVTNSGSGVMSISAITAPPPYLVAPTNFTLAGGAGTNVSVTFLPTALGASNGTLTVVSDMLTGTNTIGVAGTGVLWRATTFGGPASGTRGDALTYTATGHVSWVEALEYQFDWGDGQTTLWLSVSSTAHVWSAVSTNTVRARIRSAWHTNVFSAWAAKTNVIFDQPVVVFGPATNGLPLPVAATIGATPGTVSNVVLWFRAPGSTATNFTGQPLAYSGTVWTNLLPALNPGLLAYFLQYQQSGASLRYPPTPGSNLTYAITNALGALREEGFQSGWTNLGNFQYATTAGWTGSYVLVGTIAGMTADPNLPPSSGKYAMLFNTNVPSFFLSPLLPQGIGTIYFEAVIKNIFGPMYTASFEVQVSTNGGASFDLVVYSTNLTRNLVVRPAIALNLRQPAMVRILRTSFDANDAVNNTGIVLDNIRISPPPTDVTIDNANLLINPGYPSEKDPVTVRCRVLDVDANVPSVNRRVTVWYRHYTWPAATWTSAVLTATVENVYSGLIPTLPAGPVTISGRHDVEYYFRCEYDGYFYSNSIYASPPYSYPSENLGPVYLLPGNRPTPTAAMAPPTAGSFLFYPINQYRSENGEMWVQATPAAKSVTMKLVDDSTWLGLVKITTNDFVVTNLWWFFRGTGYYTNNAPVYMAADQYWGDVNQDSTNAPLAGLTEIGATNNPMAVNLSYDGYLMFRFCVTNNEYLVKRAVYQDFDTWDASAYYYDATSSRYGVDVFDITLGAWTPDAYPASSVASMPFTNEVVGVWQPTPYKFNGNFVGELGQIVQDVDGNQAFLLNNSTNAPGRMWNAQDALTEGIRTFSCRYRLSINDGRQALYTRPLALGVDGTDWSRPYRVVSTNRADVMSPAAGASISTLMCYRQDDLLDPSTRKYYEFRLVQVNNNINLQLYRWSGSSASLVYNSGNLSAGATLDSPYPFVLDVAWSNSGSSVSFTGRLTKASPALSYNIVPGTWVDGSPNRLTTGGVVGYQCYETVAQIQGLTVATNNGTADPGLTNRFYNLPGFVAAGNDWYYGGRHVMDNLTWWQTNSIHGTNYLTHPLPAFPSTMSISLAGTDGAGVMGPNPVLWSVVQTTTVAGASYTPYSVAFYTNAEKFLKVQFANGDLPIVVDELRIDPWRAVTRGALGAWTPPAMAGGEPFYRWTTAFGSSGQQYQWSQTEPGWAMFEGWVTNFGGFTWASFDATRGDPALFQGLLSPVLSNGMGSLGFIVRFGGPAGATNVYRVGRTQPGNLSAWDTVQTFTNVVGDPDANPYVPVLLTAAQTGNGRIRVESVRAGSSPGAILYVRNAVARSFPPTDDASWLVYNALISAITNNPYSGKSCTLNNHPTNGVASPNPGWLGVDNPYLQTPKVVTGIGEIAFQARALTNQPAYVRIMVAPDASYPLSQWVLLTNFVVTSTAWTNISFQPYDTDNKVMRIYTETNAFVYPNCGRLCLDNVLMAEPVRAGFEIVNVALNPVQPLYTNSVAVTATIGKFLMNPRNVKVYLSYNLGTNRWGYANYRGRDLLPSNTCVTVPMVQTAPGAFTYVATTNIPQRSVDEVVQYVVWGTYSGIVGRAIIQNVDSFVNPPWYYPVDLNVAHSNAGWSPYYYVFSCPPGTMWINEFNYVVKPLTELGNEYVELCGPVGTDISKWRIQIISPYASGTNAPFHVYSQGVMTNGTVIQDLTFDPYNNPKDAIADGWGFYVWGGSYVWPPPDLHGDDGSSTLLLDNAGIRLVRSMGAYEQRICYGPSDVTFEFEAQGYQYVGHKYLLPPWEAPWQLQGAGGAYSNFYWYQPSSYTHSPGFVNYDQILYTNFGPIAYHSIWSVVGPHGVQSLLVSPLPIADGQGTSIVYTADAWYRIGAFFTNGVPSPYGLGTSQYVWSVYNVQSDYSNQVIFVPATPQQTGYPSNIPTAWLMQWGLGEGVLSNYNDHDVLTLPQEYWFNSSPLVSNAFSFGTTAFSRTGNTVYASVRLLLDGARITSLNTNATLRLVASSTPAGAGSTIYETNVNATTFDTGGVWRVSRAPVTNSAVFLRPTITDTPSGWTP
jgi:hypothetical protein